MADPEPPAVDIEKLKNAYYESKSKHYGLISRLEESVDREYQARFPSGTISFRKLNHGEIDLIFRLPFVGKLVSQVELSSDEQTKFDLLKMDLLDYHAILPKSKPLWDVIKTDKKVVDALWASVHFASGMDATLSEQLDEFATDEFGFTYGAIAFMLLHKTPSELARLPESDVIFANLWFSKWNKRVGESK